MKNIIRYSSAIASGYVGVIIVLATGANVNALNMVQELFYSAIGVSLIAGFVQFLSEEFED